MPVHEISSPSRARDPADRSGQSTAPRAEGRGRDGADGAEAAVSDRRRHKRIAGLGLHVAIEAREYSVRDLSVGGFSILSYSGALRPGDTFPLRFRVVLNGFVTEFRGRGSVLRRDGEVLSAVYVTDNPRFYQGLSQYIAHQQALRLSYCGPSRSAQVSDPAFVETSA